MGLREDLPLNTQRELQIFKETYITINLQHGRDAGRRRTSHRFIMGGDDTSVMGAMRVGTAIGKRSIRTLPVPPGRPRPRSRHGVAMREQA